MGRGMAGGGRRRGQWDTEPTSLQRYPPGNWGSSRFVIAQMLPQMWQSRYYFFLQVFHTWGWLNVSSPKLLTAGWKVPRNIWAFLARNQNVFRRRHFCCWSIRESCSFKTVFLCSQNAKRKRDVLAKNLIRQKNPTTHHPLYF